MAHLIGHYRKFNNKYYKAWKAFKRKTYARAYAREVRKIHNSYAIVTKERNPRGGYEYYVWMR